MYTFKELREKLQLSPEPVKRTLRACGLDPNAKQFSEQDVERFLAARQMLDEKITDPKDKGKTGYERIAERFGGQAPPRKPATQSNSAKNKTLAAASDERPSEEALPDRQEETAALPTANSDAGELSFDIPALQARSAALGFAIEFGDLFELLEACGCAAYAEKFDASEVERFDKAVELLKQGKSLTEIREHFVGPEGKLDSFSLIDLVEQSKQKGGSDWILRRSASDSTTGSRSQYQTLYAGGSQITVDGVRVGIARGLSGATEFDEYQEGWVNSRAAVRPI